MSPTDPEDAELVDPNTQQLAQSAKKDSQGFSALYSRVAPALFAWARLRLLPELRAMFDAEDLVQEICFRAYDRFPTYDFDRASFRAWLFGIANNVLREHLVQLKRRAKRSISRESDQPAPLDSLPNETTSISRRVARDESLRRFILILESLETEEKRLLIYRGLEGLKHGEVAVLLNMSVDAAEKRWQRLVKKLEATSIPSDFFES